MSLRDISGVLQSLTNLEKVKITEEELERKSQEKNRLLGIQFKAKEAQKNYSLTEDSLQSLLVPSIPPNLPSLEYSKIFFILS